MVRSSPKITEKRRSSFIWLLFLLGVTSAVAYYVGRNLEESPPGERYRTEKVGRGDVVQSVSTNGTLNPVVLVNVGTQISGRIQHLYADFNDKVQQGQILAELDPRLIEAQLRQDRAALATAKANLRLAEVDARRLRQMVDKKFLAESEWDKAAKTVEVARAEVEKAEAQIAFQETNLHYTVIRSPISGVVVSRSVDIGQTVAASFQTPVLFQIAQDLKRMQIDTSLAEADVGNVRVGQSAHFTVDAYPDRTFSGTVKQIRLNPTILQNVVTYNVVIAVDNPEELFLPGMTAVVTIRTAERHDVLRVPLAALRFRPQAPVSVGDIPTPEGSKRVYRLAGQILQLVAVRIGIMDSKHAEVLSGDLKPGDAVVVEEFGPATPASAPSSGFRVRMF